jgi:hypothetical protein
LDTDAEARIYSLLGESPFQTELLVISYRDGPDSWLADWKRHVGQLPADLGFIHVGEATRSAVASSSETATQSLDGFVAGVGNPADLTGIGIQMSKYLERWAETDNNIIVYFDSLTALLQFVDLDDAFQFLHVFSGRVKSVAGQAYYRLDPEAHDKQTIATLQNLMTDSIKCP